MIHPYEWSEYRLLIAVTNRHQVTPFLADQVTQSEFFEHWCAMWTTDRDKKITRMEIQPLTKESYELLVPLYEAKYIVE